MNLLLKNIRLLGGITTDNKRFKRGEELKDFNCISDAYLEIQNGKIANFGPMKDCPDPSGGMKDLTGRLVLPAWCDSHTHLVFAGSREAEFIDKINGLSYAEIAAKGGGIINSALKLRAVDEEELLDQSLERAYEIMQYGTGAVEIKSGYGLSLDAELKMLRVARKIGEQTELKVKTSFLGAHAIPPEYKTNKAGYIDLIINEMLPKVAEQGLADYCDAFCEEGFFTPEETDRILKAANQFGLKPKIHANQLAISGGVQVGIANNALSVDHLEATGAEEIELLGNSNTIATALPSCSFYLNLPYTPARKLIENNAILAMATDFNPGSTPSGNVPFLISLACIKMKLLPEEALNAVTLNGAAAMEISANYGSIEIGKVANFIITEPMDNLAQIPYYFGRNHIEHVYLNGKKVK